MLSSLLNKVVLLGFLFSFFLVPQQLFAANSCTCFCGDVDLGAYKAGEYANASKCTSVCKEESQLVVGCFTDERYFPENDDKCWTEDECTSWSKEIDGTTYQGEWEGQQNPRCAKAKSGAKTGYCYGPARATKLNVPVLGTTSVSGIAEYVNLIYQFILPAMALVAVVMLMIGGLEYAISAGNVKRLESGKERMRNAVVGMVLLLFAYALANFIDPRLVNFGQLRVPLIKEAVFLDPQTSCETLMDYGFTISPSSGECGQTGTVTSTAGIKEEVANNNFKAGDTCDFQGCSLGEACMSTSAGKTCVACDDVSAAKSVYGVSVAANELNCSKIETLTNANDPNDLHKYYCEYSDNYFGDECVAVRSATDPSINCTALLSDAQYADDPCTLYEDVKISPGSTLGVSSSLSASNYYEIAESVCESDPCKVAAVKGKKSCVFTKGSTMLTANTCTAE